MPVNSELYYDIEKRLSDWLQVTPGEVTNLPLDLLNRAQNWLQEHKRWTDQMQRQELTAVAGEERTYRLPSDMVAFTIVGYDSDSDDKPDKYYYRHARHHDGYEPISEFTRTGGHSWKIKFYVDPEYTPNIYYQKRLEDFVTYDTAAEHTANPQYTFFPADLLLRTAQVLHLEESGITSSEVQVLRGSRDELIESYEQAHHNVNDDMRMEILDDSGQSVYTEASDLMGDFGSYDQYQGFENDVDL